MALNYRNKLFNGSGGSGGVGSSATTQVLFNNAGVVSGDAGLTYDAATGLATKAPIANVRAFGAVGNGVADDTAAVQAALTASRNVYFPTGTYLTSNLTVANSGTHIYGDGLSSVLLLEAGSTGALLATGVNTVLIENLALYGGDDTDKKAVATATADRSGISVRAVVNSQIRGVTVHGFENHGVVTAGGSNDFLTHLVISDSTFYNNWSGLSVENTDSEYLRVSNLDIHNNYRGLYLNAGNLTGTNCKIIDNGYGVYLYGTGNANNAHGNLSNSLINHNTYPIYAVDATLGFNLIGNNIFYGEIWLTRCTGINISDGMLDVVYYYLEGGGRNYIRNNAVGASQANSPVHNWNAVTDDTRFIDNIKGDGTVLDVAKDWLKTSTPSQTVVGSSLWSLGPWPTSSAYGALYLNGLTAAAAANFYSNSSDSNLYVNRPSGKDVEFQENLVGQVQLKTGGTLELLDSASIAWSSGNIGQAVDAGLKRLGPAKVKVTDGSTGSGNLNVGIPSYADNTAALAGGLVAGDLYYTDSAGEYVVKVAH